MAEIAHFFRSGSKKAEFNGIKLRLTADEILLETSRNYIFNIKLCDYIDGDLQAMIDELSHPIFVNGITIINGVRYTAVVCFSPDYTSVSIIPSPGTTDGCQFSFNQKYVLEYPSAVLGYIEHIKANLSLYEQRLDNIKAEFAIMIGGNMILAGNSINNPNIQYVRFYVDGMRSSFMNMEGSTHAEFVNRYVENGELIMPMSNVFSTKKAL